MRNVVLVMLSSVLLLRVESGSASPNYPSELRKVLQLAADPDCEVCHQDDYGGDRTVTKPFGRAMQQSGAFGDNDLASLRRAITQSQRNQQDSDRDGVPDIDELREGFNPNRVDHDPPPPPASGIGSGGAAGDLFGASGTSEASRAGSVEAGLPPEEPPLAADFPTRQTGCTVHGARTSPASWLGWSGAGLAAWLWRRRGPKHRWPRFLPEP